MFTQILNELPQLAVEQRYIIRFVADKQGTRGAPKSTDAFTSRARIDSHAVYQVWCTVFGSVQRDGLASLER